VYALLADGRLHLTAVVMLAPYLTPENADELLAAAAHQSKAGIEQLLAERFPRPDLPARIEALAQAMIIGAPSPGTVKTTDLQLAPGPVGPPEPARPGVAPLAPGRYALQFTVGQGTYEKLRYAQALLGHALPTGELPAVFERALDALIARLEQRKFAATDRPRRRRPSATARHVPAAVRRAVWARDGGRCTFVNEAGQRCPARTRLEFDHIEPVAMGGKATVNGVRLLCRVHNEHAAECAFGAGFMSRKREAAQQAAEEKHLRAASAERERARAAAAAAAEEARARAAAAAEVVPWLRALGLRADEARRVATQCEAVPHASLEERVRYALSCMARPARGRAAPIPRPAA
jgi:5-methylcytosine-specific restriction endonuclease McrA